MNNPNLKQPKGIIEFLLDSYEPVMSTEDKNSLLGQIKFVKRKESKKDFENMLIEDFKKELIEVGTPLDEKTEEIKFNYQQRPYVAKKRPKKSADEATDLYRYKVQRRGLYR